MRKLRNLYETEHEWNDYYIDKFIVHTKIETLSTKKKTQIQAELNHCTITPLFIAYCT